LINCGGLRGSCSFGGLQVIWRPCVGVMAELTVFYTHQPRLCLGRQEIVVYCYEGGLMNTTSPTAASPSPPAPA
jgi:hypothetical protein